MVLTADHVARAIIAAARHERINPLWVAEGHRPATHGGRLAVAHARAYAAMALHRTFPDMPAISIGRMVGSNVPSVFMAQLKRDLAQGDLRWWRDKALQAVMAAIEGEGDADDNLDSGGGVPDRGAADPGGGIDGRSGDAGAGARESDAVAAVRCDRDTARDEGEPGRSGGLSESVPAVTASYAGADTEGGVEGHADQVHNSREVAGVQTEHRDQHAAAGVESGPSDNIPSFLPPRWSDKVSMQAPRSKRALYDMLHEAVQNTKAPG